MENNQIVTEWMTTGGNAMPAKQSNSSWTQRESWRSRMRWRKKIYNMWDSVDLEKYLYVIRADNQIKTPGRQGGGPRRAIQKNHETAVKKTI